MQIYTEDNTLINIYPDFNNKENQLSPFDESGFTGVDGVHSWRLTKLFIAPLNAPQVSDVANNRMKVTTFRNAASLMSGFINRNGGWTVVGWHRHKGSHTATLISF